jgi:hypothetical protein
MKIEIQSSEVKSRSGTSQKTGRPYTIREQQAYAHIPTSAYPVEISINLRGDEQPWSPGMYQLDDASFFVDRFKSLSIGTLTLRPIAAEQKKAG